MVSYEYISTPVNSFNDNVFSAFNHLDKKDWGDWLRNTKIMKILLWMLSPGKVESLSYHSAKKKSCSCLHSSQSDGLITDKIDNRPIISTFYMFLFNLQVYATIITLTISSILAPKTLLVLTILLAKRPIMLSRLWWGTQRRSSFLLDHVSLTVFSQEQQVCH